MAEGNASKGFSLSGKASTFVYILKCSDGSYYVGHTVDLRGRLQAHNAGGAAAWTASRIPVRLVY